MAAPGIPTNFIVQQGNGAVLLSWNIMAGATTYDVYRSTNGTSFTSLASTSSNSYQDNAVTTGTQYYYQIRSSNGVDASSFTTAQSVTPVLSGQITLGQLRLQAQQRADRVGSNFVGTAEWNTYINQSAFELYDILTTTYEDYYVTAPVEFATDGISSQYNLTTVAPNFYKLMGVDCGLANTGNAWVTLKKFDFIGRNRYVFPNITSTFLGVFNLQYRTVGSTLMFIPTPAAGQFIRVWYIPRMTQLLSDNDILDGVNGWHEYVIVDVAIKALQKEESDTQALMMQKMALIKRIEESATNRDAGQPDTISDTRAGSERWGGYGPNGDGSSGGY